MRQLQLQLTPHNLPLKAIRNSFDLRSTLYRACQPDTMSFCKTWNSYFFWTFQERPQVKGRYSLWWNFCNNHNCWTVGDLGERPHHSRTDGKTCCEGQPLRVLLPQARLGKPTVHWNCCAPGDTVDGRNPANQLRLIVYPIIYRVLLHPRWLFGISSINSIPNQVIGSLFRLVFYFFKRQADTNYVVVACHSYGGDIHNTQQITSRLIRFRWLKHSILARLPVNFNQIDLFPSLTCNMIMFWTNRLLWDMAAMMPQQLRLILTWKFWVLKKKQEFKSESICHYDWCRAIKLDIGYQ